MNDAPFAIKDAVGKELDRLEEQGTIEVVPKKNGKYVASDRESGIVSRTIPIA